MTPQTTSPTATAPAPKTPQPGFHDAVAPEKSGRTPGSQQRATGPRRSGPFRCFAGSSLGRIQGLLGRHFPPLWLEIEAKWLPHAEPVPQKYIDTHGQGYARATLTDLLCGLGEAGITWDGFTIGRHLHETYGWQVNFHLCAIIHAWSCGLQEKLST
jgi:hypothetical protein